MAVGSVSTAVGTAAASTTAPQYTRLDNLKFELAFGGQSDDAKGITYRKHVAGAQSETERREMFSAYLSSLSPAGQANISNYFRALEAAQHTRMENLKFELAFGGRSDDARIQTYHKHAAGAQSDGERAEMFGVMYRSLTWGGRANITRFFGGQKPVRIPELDSRISRAFAGRTPPAYEVTLPANGQQSKGVMLAVHGGGWVFVGPGTLRAMDGDVNRWNERGWTVVNVDYRAGAASVPDVIAFYDAIRSWKPDAKIGATGQSAGGHLSMMVAAKRPDLNFVVSQAGPSDLVHLDEGTQASHDLKAGVDKLWDAAGQQANSPALNAGIMGARMLVATAQADQLVPPMQGERMRRARPDLVEKMDLERGNDYGFIHGMVSQRAIDEFYAHELALSQRA